ncbi:MAG: leucine-rich repeat protein, partial [Eubacteriaceae bacterium]|nr:leucine-rich repeat protein [Eubacteriaceae bacterium]
KTTAEPSTSTVENKDSQNNKEEEIQSDNSNDDKNLLKDKVTESYLLKNANTAYTKTDKAELKNLVLVKQTLFDGSKLKEDENLNIMNDAYNRFDTILGQFLIDIPVFNLSDESEYYVAYINTMQDDTNASVRDFEFAKNNDLGEVLDGCIYDQNTGIAYIPKSLFTKDKDNNQILEPVQIQLMQVISNNNSKIEDISLKTCAASQEGNDETHTTDSNALSKIYDDTVTVQSKPGLDPNNIIVYVNGYVSSPADYEYNKETGQVTVSGSPTIVGNVTVEEATSEQEKQLDEIYPQDVNLKTQDLDTSSMKSNDHGGTLNIPKNTKVGDVIDGSATYYYVPYSSYTMAVRDEELAAGELSGAYLIKRKGKSLTESFNLDGVDAGYGKSFMRWINNGQTYIPASEAEAKSLGADTELNPNASIWNGYSFIADFNDGNQNFRFQDGRTADLSFLHKVAFSCVHVGVDSQTAIDWMSSVNNGEVYTNKIASDPDKYIIPMRMRFYKIDGNYAILGVLAARVTSYSGDQAGYGLIKVPISKIPSVSFKKTAKSVTGNELEGANFELYEYNNITKSKGNYIKSFSSRTGGVEFTDLEKNKYYYIEEVNAPNGYQPIEPIAFYVNNNNEVSFANNTKNAQKIENGDTIVVADKPVGMAEVDLRINKMNILEEILPDARLQLYKWDPSGEGSSEWVRYRSSVTSGDNLEIQNIDFPAKYKIVEQTAPTNVNGYDYKIFEGNCFFELDEDGRISKSEGASGDFSVENNLDEGQVILNMVDESTTPLPTPPPQFKVGINKKSDNLGGPVLTGAQFEIRETENGSAIDSLASKSSTVYSQKHLKLDQTYYLVETSAPSGYKKLENPIKFHMDSNGNIAVEENLNGDEKVSVSGNEFTIANVPGEDYVPPTVPDVEYPPYTPLPPVVTPTPADPVVTPPTYNRISIRKADIKGQPLAGSCIEIYDDTSKDPIDTLYPGTDTVQSAYHLENNQIYTLREKTAPNDYVAIQDIKFKVYNGTITVTDNPNASSLIDVNGELLTIKNELQTHKIKIKKVNSEGELLANAVLQIKRSGELINLASKTTVAGEPSEFDLQAGTYLLHEQTAPRGYETITDFYFSVDSSGNVLVSSSNGNTVKAEGDTLTVTDKSAPYDLTINKVDPNGNPLAGAILQLTNDPTLSTQSYKSNNTNDSDINLGTLSASEKEEILSKSDAEFNNGRAFNAKCYQLAGGLENIVAFERVDEPLNKDNVLSTSSSCPIYAGYNADKKTIWWSTKAQYVYMNSDSASMFKGMTNLKSLGKGNEFGADTLYVKTFAHAFEDCASLESINFSSHSFVSVYDTSAMFKNCQSLKTVVFPKSTEEKDVSIYPTNIEKMFEGCKSLETIDLSILKNVGIQKADALFKDCSSLKTIITDGNFNLDTGYHIFENASNLVGGNGTKWTEGHINHDAAFVDNELQKGYFTSIANQENKQESIEKVNLKTNSADTNDNKEPKFEEVNLKSQATTPTISYRGWRFMQAAETASDGALMGTTGNGLRLEKYAVGITNSSYSGSVTYQAYYCHGTGDATTGTWSKYGWVSRSSSVGTSATSAQETDCLSGTSYVRQSITGIKVSLSGEIANYYDVYYNAHLAYTGDTSWVKNGTLCGSEGAMLSAAEQNSEKAITDPKRNEIYRRIEGIRIKLVPKPGVTYTLKEKKDGSWNTRTDTVSYENIGTTKNYSYSGNDTYAGYSYSLKWDGSSVTVSNTTNCSVTTSTTRAGSTSSTGTTDAAVTVTVTPTKEKKDAIFNFKYNNNGTYSTLVSGVSCSNGSSTSKYWLSSYVSASSGGNKWEDFGIGASWNNGTVSNGATTASAWPSSLKSNCSGITP